MRIAEIMIVFAWSSLGTTVGIVFPWWMWLLAAFDVIVRIADDHKEWLKDKQSNLLKDIKELEEIRLRLYHDIREQEEKSGVKARE
jgi:hypothetical protein